jgi:hypothetical protein
VPLVVGVSLRNFEEQLKHAESSAKALEERPSGSRDLRIKNIKGGFNPVITHMNGGIKTIKRNGDVVGYATST